MCRSIGRSVIVRSAGLLEAGILKQRDHGRIVRDRNSVSPMVSTTRSSVRRSDLTTNGSHAGRASAVMVVINFLSYVSANSY